jgi:hypothetical protein
MKNNGNGSGAGGLEVVGDIAPVKAGRGKKVGGAEPEKLPERRELKLPVLEERELTCTCVGVEMLVMNSMLNKVSSDKQVQTTGGKPTDEESFNRARYVVEGRDAFKAMTLKKAIMAAWPFTGKGAMFLGVVKKVLYVHGDVRSEDGTPFIAIDGKAEMFKTEIRTDDGKSLLVTRPRYFPWAFQARITYNPRHVDDQLVLNLLQSAGVYCGLGENRASKTGGSWGRFQIDATKPIVARTIKSGG